MASRKLQVEIIGDASSLNRAFRQASNSGSRLGGGLRTLGKVAIATGVALGAGVAAGAFKAINASSDLTEQINKANVVFRGNQKEVIEWSKGLEQSFGLSQRAALEAAGTFGNMLVPMGFARKEAAGMSEQMVQLAGDMASFNNASPEDTLLAIRSGLAGEAEPLRKYGVFLSAARIEQEALTETGKKNAKQLTVQEKTLAAYNLVLKDTKDTQGDFARSAGTSLANQIRILKAQFEDVSASVGKVFTPILITALRHVSDFFARLSKAEGIQAKFKVAIGGIAGIIGDLLKKMVEVATSTDWGAVARAVRDGVIGALTRVWEGGAVAKGGPGQAMNRGIQDMVNEVDWGKLGQSIGDGIRLGISNVGDLAKTVVDTIGRATDQINWEELGRRMGPGLVTAMLAAIAVLNDPGFWARNWDLILAAALVALGGPISKFASRWGESLLLALAGPIERISPRLAAAFVAMMERLPSVVIAPLRALENVVVAAFGRLGKIAVFAVKVLGVLTVINLMADLARKVGEAISRIIDWFRRLPGRVQAELGKMAAAIENTAGQAYGWAVAIGEAIVRGILAGLVSLPGALADKLGGLVKGAISAAGNLLHGSGPWMFTINTVGIPLAKGVIEGFEKGIGPLPVIVSAKVSEAAKKAKEAVEKAQAGYKTAWEGYTSKALEAFDNMSSKLLTKSEKLLAALNKKETLDGLINGINEAKKALEDAKLGVIISGGFTPPTFEADPAKTAEENAAALAAVQQAALNEWVANNQAAQQQVTAAQDALNAALLAKKKYGLEQQATEERTKLDEHIAIWRMRFEDWLATRTVQQQQAILQEGKGQAGIVAKIKSYNKAYYDRGVALGESLAFGLLDARGKVEDAADQLAAAVAKSLGVATNLGKTAVGDAEARQNQFRARLGLPELAAGGIVTRPTIALIGESGPEAVVPLNRAGGGVTINVYASGVIGDESRVINRIRAGLADVARDNPNIFGSLA